MATKREPFKKWLDRNFEITQWDPKVDGTEPFDIYVSRLDKSYGDPVHDPQVLRWLWKKGVTEHLQYAREQTVNAGISTITMGYNPVEEKWYGWSHRAYSGFGVGSTIALGSVSYQPDNKENFKSWVITQYDNEVYKLVSADEETEGVRVKYVHNDQGLNGTARIREIFEPYPVVWGKGHWTATTLDEAKEMARHFAWGVG